MAESQAVTVDWGERRQSGVFHRSSRVLVTAQTGDDTEAASDDKSEVPNGSNIAGDDDHHEIIKLPQSTHSFLFTEKVFSQPFFLGLSVLCVSISCLVLALFDNLSGGTPGNKLNVPANVPPAVRAAQYFSILIALTMEEEIPTASYLLRMIPKSSVESKLKVSYARFAMSAIVRLVIGYM